MRIQGSTATKANSWANYIDRWGTKAQTTQSTNSASGTSTSGLNAESTTKSSVQSSELTDEQKSQVEELAQIDRKVRAHEQAHRSVGGDLVRGSSYSYTQGPDGKRYVTAGEVSIDTSPGRTPEETVPKAEHIIRTALAPADPSAQDRAVASKATSMKMEAQSQVNQEKSEEASEAREGQSNPRQARGLEAYSAANNTNENSAPTLQIQA